MVQIPDDPIIHSLEQYGVPPWQRDEYEPTCPICGMTCEYVYKNGSEIVGCDVCLERCDADDEEECHPNRGREW